MATCQSPPMATRDSLSSGSALRSRDSGQREGTAEGPQCLLRDPLARVVGGLCCHAPDPSLDRCPQWPLGKDQGLRAAPVPHEGHRNLGQFSLLTSLQGSPTSPGVHLPPFLFPHVLWVHCSRARRGTVAVYAPISPQHSPLPARPHPLGVPTFLPQPPPDCGLLGFSPLCLRHLTQLAGSLLTELAGSLQDVCWTGGLHGARGCGAQSTTVG